MGFSWGRFGGLKHHDDPAYLSAVGNGLRYAKLIGREVLAPADGLPSPAQARQAAWAREEVWKQQASGGCKSVALLSIWLIIGRVTVYHKPSVPFIVPKLGDPRAAETICRYLRGEGEFAYHVNWGPNPPPPPPKPMEFGDDGDY